MKAKFKQSQKHWRFYLVFFNYVLIIIGSFFSKVLIPFLIIYFPIIMLFFRKYQITDDDILTGNGNVSIQDIQKLVYQKDRIDVYYKMPEKDRLNIKAFYVADKQGFIGKLKEINPSIRVI